MQGYNAPNDFNTATKIAGLRFDAPREKLTLLDQRRLTAAGLAFFCPVPGGAGAQLLGSRPGHRCLNVVPVVTGGWDNRPFIETPVSWYATASTNYVLSPTSAELAGHLADALNWTSAYRTSSTPANTVLVYAWNEHAEGGWLCPTVNTNTGAPDTTRLSAIRSVIAPVSSTASLLGNASFEAPSVSAGWYTVPPGGMPAAFGWSNNFAAGAICPG